MNKTSAAPLDVQALRRDFPVLQRQVNGHPLAFLDSAASSQKPTQVVQAMVDYYYGHHANVHRGAHTLAAEATDAYELARAKVARFIGAQADEVIFTRNTTEALNLVACSWGRSQLQAGDEVVLSVAEHHANLLPWQRLRDAAGVVLRFVPLTPEQRLDMQALERVIGPRTRLVTTFHMSNVLGAINPIRRIADLAHAVGAVLLVDGAQGAPHLPVDVTALGADFYALSGHKMLAPTGIGALYGRRQLLQQMPPMLLGGEMIRKVTLAGATYAEPPKRFEAGTPAIAEAVGLGAAVDYLQALSMQSVHEHCQALTRRAITGLRQIGGVTLYGPEGDDRGGVVSFAVDGVHPHDLATLLDQVGVAVRAGNHCAQPLAQELGIRATARASFYLYNTEEEVDRLVTAVADVKRRFARVTAGR
jgi:cysteine desulfurase/selenocysteine lyase